MAVAILDDNDTRKTNNNYTEQDSFNALFQELNQGIQSICNGDTFTLEEAWKEIDKISESHLDLFTFFDYDKEK